MYVSSLNHLDPKLRERMRAQMRLYTLECYPRPARAETWRTLTGPICLVFTWLADNQTIRLCICVLAIKLEINIHLCVQHITRARPLFPLIAFNQLIDQSRRAIVRAADMRSTQQAAHKLVHNQSTERRGWWIRWSGSWAGCRRRWLDDALGFHVRMGLWNWDVNLRIHRHTFSKMTEKCKAQCGAHTSTWTPRQVGISPSPNEERTCLGVTRVGERE